ncbi:MAG: DeoR/GlpR family DNA-binding transcription regulator [Clostridia bacterium]
MKTDRLASMEEYIHLAEIVSMPELCERFQVSMNTVRRDVSELLKKGSVEKVYGGVCSRKTQGQALKPFDARCIDNESAKQAIGRRAAELVQDGDIIFVDSGTTTLQIIEHLITKQDLTIVTNNLEVILRALPYDNLNIIALPGQLRRKTHSFTGMSAVRELRAYNIRKAFLASTGATLQGVTNSSPLEYEIKRCAVENSEQSILMLCSAKFSVAGLMTYATFGDFDSIITDQSLPQPYAAAIEESGAKLLLPSNHQG